jgi:hypothetical protein
MKNAAGPSNCCQGRYLAMSSKRPGQANFSMLYFTLYL